MRRFGHGLVRKEALALGEKCGRVGCAARAAGDGAFGKMNVGAGRSRQLRTAVESLGRQPDAADQAYAELREQCSSNTDILAAYLDGSVEMVEQICQIAEDDRNGVVDFAAAEQGLKRGSAKVNSAALAALIEKGDDAKKRRADIRCPDCGEAAQHDRRRERTLLSCFGHLKVRLHSWRCARCERTFRPREFQLGVDGGRKATRGMCRMLAIAGANQSFEDASTTLAELTGVSVNAKMVERETERLGRSMAAEEKADGCPATTTLTDDVAADATAYMEVDGTGVGMRPEETEGRAGKHADGRARTREAKPCRGVVGTASRAGRERVVQRRHRKRRAAGRATGDRRAVLASVWARSDAQRLLQGESTGDSRRRRAVDLEHGGRDVSGRHPDPGRVPCAGKDARRVQGSLRFPGVGISTASGLGEARETGRRGGGNEVSGSRFGGALHRRQPASHGLSPLSTGRPEALVVACRKRLPERDRRTIEAKRHALDGGRRERHAGVALLCEKQALERLLQTAPRDHGRAIDAVRDHDNACNGISSVPAPIAGFVVHPYAPVR